MTKVRRLGTRIVLGTCECPRFFPHFFHVCRKTYKIHLCNCYEDAMPSDANIERILNHEVIHLVLKCVAGKQASKHFDRIFRGNPDAVDYHGCLTEQKLNPKLKRGRRNATSHLDGRAHDSRRVQG